MTPSSDRMRSAPVRVVPRQGGSILVQFALVLALLVTILGIVDIGYMYYAKRDLQRIADLAAIEAVQNIDYGKGDPLGNCVNGGLESIENNWPIAIAKNSETFVKCGNWDVSNASDPQRHFIETTNLDLLNAAHVRVQGSSPIIIPGPWGRVVVAEAVAKRENPLAVFSVGTTLVSVGCHQQLAPLVQLLRVVGVGDPCVTVGGYEGLVGAQVSASGLLKALGLPLEADLTVVDVNNLLAAEKVSLGFLLDTALTLGGHEELLGLNAELLSLIEARLGIEALNIEIPLGAGPDGPGIFASIHAPDGTTASALDVQVNVLDIVTAAIGVGTSGRGISLDVSRVGVPGLLPDVLTIEAGIIEPPSIGIGGVGATAYNAQVRLYIDVDTYNTDSGINLIGGLLNLLGTRIHLPIFVDVVRTKGTIEDLTCRVPGGDSTVRVGLDSSVANVCVGRAAGNPFSTRTPICESLDNETLVSVLGLVKINNRININALQDDYLSPDMRAGETWRSPGNGLNLGDTVSDLVDELLRLLGELLGSPTNGEWSESENEESASKLADYYLGKSSPGHPAGAIPKNQSLDFGLIRGPVGIYDVSLLRDRLKADIDRTTQSCFLLPFLCWQNNEWDAWAKDIESANVLSGRACWGSTPEGWVTAGSAGTAEDVDRFNRCVERELKEALLEAPDSRPNFLQVLLSPLLDVLEAILNPIGNLLAGPILGDLLGVELGVNDVRVTSIGCNNAHIVY
ncbi:pilus assembly protein TadG-related protein [Lampropedia cohaerens]|uniref:pilus assembly protein TadG-related protein n=1 Tax=Lampropedia cohaerens TaxID=1610491 RepID=UPI000A937F12|nr:pilus assembly protein TadG-related protein [Lampropedia cohaerens]